MTCSEVQRGKGFLKFPYRRTIVDAMEV